LAGQDTDYSMHDHASQVRGISSTPRAIASERI
jgi:hypothetical protein